MFSSLLCVKCLQNCCPCVCVCVHKMPRYTAQSFDRDTRGGCLCRPATDKCHRWTMGDQSRPINDQLDTNTDSVCQGKMKTSIHNIKPGLPPMRADHVVVLGCAQRRYSPYSLLHCRWRPQLPSVSETGTPPIVIGLFRPIGPHLSLRGK